MKFGSWGVTLVIGCVIGCVAARAQDAATAASATPDAGPVNGAITGVVMDVGADFKLNGDVTNGAAIFKLYCLLCHGETGHGDGVGSVALTPKPRNFTDKALMSTIPDNQIFTVIKEGGAYVGKSLFMVSWKAILTNDQQIIDVGTYIRTFSK